jgi:hypothetical protein
LVQSRPDHELIANTSSHPDHQLIANTANPQKAPAHQLTEPAESVTEVHRIYLSAPVMMRLSGAQILFSRAMPTWLRITHYIEEIIAKFWKLHELENALGKVSQLKAGICRDNIDKLKSGLQTIEDEANQIVRSSYSQDFAMLTRGKRPFQMQLAGSRRTG